MGDPTPYISLAAPTHFRATLTRSTSRTQHSTSRTQHSQLGGPLQLSPLYEVFVREHPLHSLGTLLRLDFSVCNTPVALSSLKNPRIPF
jgi:hypothetical protein